MPLPVKPSIAPMLAQRAKDIPAGDYLYEPKWDGFRCLAFIAAGEVDLRSRHDRRFARYFPELVSALSTIGSDVVLDGEIVIGGPHGLDFPALLSRLHPSPSRVARLAAEVPATFVAFDLLAVGAEDLRARPFFERRAWLEQMLAAAPPQVLATPITSELEVARTWLARFEGGLAGSAGRWDPSSMTLDWIPLRPEAVAELAYDQLDASRFRHPARFVRWRPDREPRSCTFDQFGLAPAR